MISYYYCKKCKEEFFAEELPNINRLCDVCGKIVKLIEHQADDDE